MCLAVYACKKVLTHVLRKMKASSTNWLIWILYLKPCFANILSRICQIRDRDTLQRSKKLIRRTFAFKLVHLYYVLVLFSSILDLSTDVSQTSENPYQVVGSSFTGTLDKYLFRSTTTLKSWMDIFRVLSHLRFACYRRKNGNQLFLALKQNAFNFTRLIPYSSL